MVTLVTGTRGVLDIYPAWSEGTQVFSFYVGAYHLVVALDFGANGPETFRAPLFP